MVNLLTEYSDKPVTLFDGMALLKRFVDQTSIRKHLAALDLPRGQPCLHRALRVPMATHAS